MGAASHPRFAPGEPVPSALVTVEFEELRLPLEDQPAIARCVVNRDPMGTFACCPMCGGEMRPEHAHYRCACGWRDSCCD